MALGNFKISEIQIVGLRSGQFSEY